MIYVACHFYFISVIINKNFGFQRRVLNNSWPLTIIGRSYQILLIWLQGSNRVHYQGRYIVIILCIGFIYYPFIQEFQPRHFLL